MLKIQHSEYAKTDVEIGLTSTVEDWTSLPETKRDANWALFRHAVIKTRISGRWFPTT